MDAILASPAASVLLAIILAASLVGLRLWPALIEANLFRPYWFFRRGEYATAITSGFLHADLGHLLFNGITFWAFAFPLERMIGTGKFLALYFFGLLVSDAGTWLKHRHDPGYRCLGASGAILAVLFAAIVYVPGASIFILPIPVPIPAPLFAVLYVAYSIWAARRARGRINHDAHLAGAFAGIVFVAVVDTASLVRLWQHLLA